MGGVLKAQGPLDMSKAHLASKEERFGRGPRTLTGHEKHTAAPSSFQIKHAQKKMLPPADWDQMTRHEKTLETTQQSQNIEVSAELAGP